MSDNNVTQLINKDKYQQEQNLLRDLIEVINDYQGKVGVAAALGILDLVKDEVKLAKERENK